MLQKYLIRVISGVETGLLARLTLILLSILEIIYCFFLQMRYFIYKYQLRKPGSLTCRVISVGNITAGGTGKTPLIKLLAQAIQDSGEKVVIVSRGYGGKNDKPLIISKGWGPEVDVQTAGDESYMLSQQLPRIPLVIGKERLAAGKLAVTRFNPALVLLDDGFQHFNLKRDLDIVLIDALNPFGRKHLLPRGFLREPLTALKRARIIIITKTNFVSAQEEKRIRQEISGYNSEAILLSAKYIPVYLRSLQYGLEGEFRSLTELKDQKVIALSGIGNPESFQKSLQDLGAIVEKQLTFADHHQYQKEDFYNLVGEIESQGIDLIVTTEKDAAKFTPEMLKFVPEILILGIQLEVSDKNKLVDICTG